MWIRVTVKINYHSNQKTEKNPFQAHLNQSGGMLTMVTNIKRSGKLRFNSFK